MRTIRDIAIPLEQIAEWAGLDVVPVGGSFSSNSNVLYLRIPAEPTYKQVFSTRVVKKSGHSLEVELFRLSIPPAEKTSRGAQIPTYKYEPNTLGTFTITTGDLPPYDPSEGFDWIPTDPRVLEELMGAAPDSIEAVSVNGVMVYMRLKEDDAIITFPARNLPKSTECP